MAFRQERSEIERTEAISGRKIIYVNNLFSRLILHFNKILNSTLNWKKSTVAFRVQSYIDGGLDEDLIAPNNGENIARKRRKLGIDGGNAAAIRDEFMFPPSTALWKKTADGRTLLPEFSLANIG